MNRSLMSGLLALALCVCQGMMAQDTLKKFDLQELVVTGTGTLHLLKDAPVQTEVITGKQLKNFGGLCKTVGERAAAREGVRNPYH